MKSKYLFALIFTASIFSTSGQIICGTPPPNQSSLQQKTILNPEFLNPSYPICVDVFYHIVKNTNGTGGFNPSSLSAVTAILNQGFNPYNFYINGTGYDFITNTDYYEYINNVNEFNALVQIKNQSDAINIYIVDDAYFTGRADGYLSQAHCHPKVFQY